MLAWVEDGCLHGPVFLLSEDRRLLFSGFFHNGRPQGWVAAASPIDLFHLLIFEVKFSEFGGRIFSFPTPAVPLTTFCPDLAFS